MLTQIAAPAFYMILFTAIVYRWRFFHLPSIPKGWMLGAFWLKIVAGFVFWLVYTYYYTDPSASDALRYFDDAMTIKHQWSVNKDVFWSFMLGRDMDHPEYVKVYNQLIAWTSGYRYGLSNDCSTIIRINVLLSFISFANFHVHAIMMSFLSFIGFTAMFRAFHAVLLRREKWLFVACFLLPSVVFWSSSVLKEAPLFLTFGLMLYSLVSIWNDSRKYFQYCIFVICFVILIYVKVYVIISVIPALLSLIVLKVIGTRWIVVKFAVVHLLCFIAAQNAHHFFRGGDFLYVLHKKQVDFYNVAFLRDAGSAVEIPAVTSVSQFIVHYPEAFFLTYFRPHIFEAHSLTAMLFASEYFLYLIVFVLAIVFFRKPPKNQWPLLLTIFSYLLILAAILGNTVPILGAMVRYKVVGLPALLILCVAVIHWERINRLFRRFKTVIS